MKLKNIFEFNNEKNELLETDDESCHICEHAVSEFVMDCLAIRDQSHIYHWQTKLHSQHESFQEFYETFIDQLDELVELIMGSEMNTNLSFEGMSIDLFDIREDEDYKDFIEFCRHVFIEKVIDVVPQKFSHIHNKIEEIIEIVDKLNYKLSLR